MKSKKIIFIVLTIVVFLIIWIFSPYIKAEILTYKYGEMFEEEYMQTNMIDEIEYYKVVDYSDTMAKVLYVEKNHITGNLIVFTKDNNNWKLLLWKAVWSTTGSADEFMWPYYK